MDRRKLIVTGLVAIGAPTLVRAQQASDGALPPPGVQTNYPANNPPTYEQDEIVKGVSDFLGVTAESAGAAVERLFSKNGKPTAYIAGEEGSGAIVVGARYGRGLLYMKDRPPMEVFWQGPSAGWDYGGNVSGWNGGAMEGQLADGGFGLCPPDFANDEWPAGYPEGDAVFSSALPVVIAHPPTVCTFAVIVGENDP